VVENFRTLPKQWFDLKIQASFDGRIIATSRRKSAMKDDRLSQAGGRHQRQNETFENKRKAKKNARPR